MHLIYFLQSGNNMQQQFCSPDCGKCNSGKLGERDSPDSSERENKETDSVSGTERQTVIYSNIFQPSLFESII